jgi:hypothetical protein
MGVQVRIKGARGFMREQGGSKIVGIAVSLCAPQSYASGGKRLKFLQSDFHSPQVSLRNTVIGSSQGRNGNPSAPN